MHLLKTITISFNHELLLLYLKKVFITRQVHVYVVVIYLPEIWFTNKTSTYYSITGVILDSRPCTTRKSLIWTERTSCVPIGELPLLVKYYFLLLNLARFLERCADENICIKMRQNSHGESCDIKRFSQHSL
jgi:hypothetical protein